MAAFIENTGSGLARWEQAIDQGSRGIGVVCYSCMLDGVRGQVSLSSRLGRWMQAISDVADGDTSKACLLIDYLKAAGGEVSLSSPFGRWALRVSARFCGSPLGF